MTTIVDSHCHLDMLDLEPHQGSLDAVIEQAKLHDVKHILTISTEMATFPRVLEIAKQYPNVTASMGSHPSEQEPVEPTVDQLIELGSDPNVVAIGETGLDYYYNDSGYDLQQERFRRHIQAARELKKPLIIHTRDAKEDTIRILREEKAEEVAGVLHCFTESLEMADQGMDMGFYVSFSGIVTFKNAANVREIADHVPLDRMLVETDAPYLTPTPHRGKPNYPAYTRYVAEFLAELKEVSLEEMAQVTTRNFTQLFGVNVE